MIRLIVIICMMLAILALPDSAMAQVIPAPTGNDSPPAGQCTTDPTFNVPTSINVISTVIDSVSCVLYGSSNTVPCNVSGSVAGNMFEGITGNFQYRVVVQATASLFIMIFAISFMLGIVQLSIVELTVRVIKVSIVLFFIVGGGWLFFYNIVGIFFQNGTNWLIGRATQIAIGTIPGINVNDPFALIDYAIATAFSAKMFVTIMAMLFTGPYGWLYFILVILGLGSFVAALFQAIWIYLMSMVVRAFLFGLAPLFFIFLLFQRTRHLFDGWLNQLVNSMLQPVLLFTFFSFFVVLVQAGMQNILNTPACYLPGRALLDGLPGDSVTPKLSIWINGGWQAYGEPHDWNGPVDFPGAATFPIDIIDVLIFVLLTQLAWRFNSIAINIAKEIAGVSTTFNMPGAFSNILSPRHSATNRALGEFDRYREQPEMRAAQAAAGGAPAPAQGGGVAGQAGRLAGGRKGVGG